MIDNKEFVRGKKLFSIDKQDFSAKFAMDRVPPTVIRFFLAQPSSFTTEAGKQALIRHDCVGCHAGAKPAGAQAESPSASK
jgi:hypothetical protein